MYFADAESNNFLCRWRRSGGGDIILKQHAYVLLQNSQFCGAKAESELNISMICGGRVDAEQNFSESERTWSHKNETPSICGPYELYNMESLNNKFTNFTTSSLSGGLQAKENYLREAW